MFAFIIAVCFNMYWFIVYRDEYIDGWTFRWKLGAFMNYGYALFAVACLYAFLKGWMSF